MEDLLKKGFEIVDFDEGADIYIINSTPKRISRHTLIRDENLIIRFNH